MQSIYLNLIPGTVKPVINLSQFDEGREFSLTIINGASAADLTGATVTISGRKKDDTAFSYGTSDYVKGNPVVSVAGNVVTIRNTLQMAILAGDVLATLSISKTASDVSTLDFVIKVQENPLDGVDISETEIPGIVALAEEQVEEAEAWAKGTKGGNPVTSDDPQYDNNAKYWSDRAAQYAAGALHYVGSVTFANIPVSGMSNGDMYNITTDFTTDNRFIEGAGISCKAGTDIAWVASVSKWDLPLVVPTTPAVTVDNAMSTSSTNPLENRVITNALAAGRISFGVDAQGNWGYKKDGADTVIPFSSKNDINVNRHQPYSGALSAQGSYTVSWLNGDNFYQHNGKQILITLRNISQDPDATGGPISLSYSGCTLKTSLSDSGNYKSKVFQLPNNNNWSILVTYTANETPTCWSLEFYWIE